jgi:hypothetical protein
VSARASKGIREIPKIDCSEKTCRRNGQLEAEQKNQAHKRSELIA